MIVKFLSTQPAPLADPNLYFQQFTLLTYLLHTQDGTLCFSATTIHYLMKDCMELLLWVTELLLNLQLVWKCLILWISVPEISVVFTFDKIKKSCNVYFVAFPPPVERKESYDLSTSLLPTPCLDEIYRSRWILGQVQFISILCNRDFFLRLQR